MNVYGVFNFGIIDRFFLPYSIYYVPYISCLLFCLRYMLLCVCIYVYILYDKECELKVLSKIL